MSNENTTPKLDATHIKLNVKLRAYARGIIPDVSGFIEDAPSDNVIYARLNGEWKSIRDNFKANEVIIEDGSGLERKVLDEETNTISLSIKQKVLWEHDLPYRLKDDTTYYIIEDEPDIYINGGTAYSDENEEFHWRVKGGKADNIDINYDVICVPMNAKGEYRC